jgi:GT2 family glycosyltransferase
MSTVATKRSKVRRESENAATKPFLIITGMHRSGTSFLARALNLAGVYLGEPEELISDEWRPRPDNLRGHWESKGFLELAEKTLEINGGTWDNPPRAISIDEETGRKIGQQATKLLDHPSLAAGFKDPRVILCLESWLQYLPDNFIIVGIFRNPIKVVESLKNRNNFSYEKSLSLWNIYNEKLISLIEKYDGFLLDFDWSKDRLLSELSLIIKKLGLVETDLSEWYSEDLVHSWKSSQSSIADTAVASLYSRLKIRSENNPNVKTNLVTPVDQRDVIHGLLLDMQAQSTYFKKLHEQELGAIKNALQSREQWIERLKHDIATTNARLAELQKEFEERTKWALELDKTVRELGQSLSLTESQNLTMRNDLALKESQLAEINNSVIYGIARKVAGFIDKVAPPSSSRGNFVRLVRTAIAVRKQQGTNVMLYHARKKILNDVKQSVHSVNTQQNRAAVVEAKNELAQIERAHQGFEQWLKEQGTTILSPPEELLPADESLREFLAFGSSNFFKLANYPLVSIIIPTYDNLEDLRKNLISIETKTTYPKYEIIIITNNLDANSPMRRYLDTLRHQVYVYDKEYSFSGVNNFGASKANGELLLFLNDDTEVVEPRWLEAMVKLAQRPSTGVVGGKMLYPDRKLQEAGGIVWGDGNAWNYGRFWLDPSDPAVNYVREIDYCSASFLLVKKSVFDAVGGFDMNFSPAYYEDTDLCFAVRDKGYRVLYQPSSVIVHKEGATLGTNISKGMKAYQPINQKKFYEKWKHKFKGRLLASYENAIVGKSRKSGKKILYIDHHVPTPDQDSGSLRTFYMLGILSWLGHDVTFWPDNLYRSEPYVTELQQKGIEVVYGPHKFEDFMRQRGRYFDIVILSRPHVSINYLDKVRKLAPHCMVLYDTVDLHHLRMYRQSSIEDKPDIAEEAMKIKEAEMKLINSSDLTFIVSKKEGYTLRQKGVSTSLAVLPNTHVPPKKVKSFDSRQNLFFIGSFQHQPNIDAAIFLARDVFPLIKERLGKVKLFIVGSNPPHSIRELAELDDIIVTGYVPEIGSFLEGCKIMIAPIRYGAGIKGKITESMSYGLPVVTTTVGAEGMDMIDGESIMIADSARGIADKTIELYNNKDLWEKISSKSYELAAKRYSPEVVCKILDKLFAVEVQGSKIAG